jgi:hypothetical protein
MVEPIFNTVRGVARTALVGVTRNGVTFPVVCVELTPEGRQELWWDLYRRMEMWGWKYPPTKYIAKFLPYDGSFPVDVRHNSKIFREKLAVWADKELGPKWNPEAAKTEAKATA